jgi:hypothetical protein
MHTQSMPGCAAIVPLLSIAMKNPPHAAPRPARRRPAASARPRQHDEALVARRAPETLDRRDQRRRIGEAPAAQAVDPTKSVSQKRQMALARSCSRPDHRLHPAKRTNTARRPPAPLALGVRNISLTA